MKYLVLVALVAFYACDPKPKTPVTATALNASSGGPNNWNVNNGIATAMINSAKGKACNQFSITNSNAAVQASIDSLYPPDQFSRSFVLARYVTDADAAMYRRMRNMSPGDPRGSVKGLCNNIYQIRSISTSTQSQTVEYFYDFLVICPPPPDCDRDTTKNHDGDTSTINQ